MQGITKCESGADKIYAFGLLTSCHNRIAACNRAHWAERDRRKRERENSSLTPDLDTDTLASPPNPTIFEPLLLLLPPLLPFLKP